MNEKISKYLREKITSKQGVETMIGEVTIAFGTWLHNHPFNIHRELYQEILEWNKLKPPSITELYQYWIDNVFKINE